jgi:branched-chain amino acid transport system substrate-binding protein
MHRTRHLKVASILTVLVVAVAFAAPAGAGADRGNKDGQLIIGHLGPESGDLAAIIDSLRVPVNLAIDEINAAGGVNGQQVTLVTGDDGGGSEPQTASATLDRMLTSDKVDAIIGPAASPDVEATADKIETNAATMCSGSTTSPALSPKGYAGGYFFRTAPPDKLQAPATAELVLSEGHSRVAILSLRNAYGRGYAKAMSKALKQGGAKVVANETYDPDGSQFDAEADKVANVNADAIALIAYPDTGSKVIQALIGAGAGPADVPLFTTDGLDSSDIPELVDPANLGSVNGVQGTTPAAAPAGIEHPFQATFAATGVDTVFSSYYYDCTILTALAAVKAKSDDPAKFRKQFTANIKGDEDCQTFADCKALLDEGSTIHYRGASSAFDKFSDHEPLSGVYDVYTFDTAGEKSTLGDDAQIAIG